MTQRIEKLSSCFSWNLSKHYLFIPAIFAVCLVHSLPAESIPESQTPNHETYILWSALRPVLEKRLRDVSAELNRAEKFFKANPALDPVKAKFQFISSSAERRESYLRQLRSEIAGLQQTLAQGEKNDAVARIQFSGSNAIEAFVAFPISAIPNESARNLFLK